MVSENANAAFEVFAGPRCFYPRCAGYLSSTLRSQLHGAVAWECDICTRWFYHMDDGEWMKHGCDQYEKTDLAD